jgi:hypothetical protein
MNSKYDAHFAICGYAAEQKPCDVCDSLKKNSPSARGRGVPSREARSQPRANSSERAADQKPTPGEKRIGESTAKLHRRLRDAGDDFEERLKKT